MQPDLTVLAMSVIAALVVQIAPGCLVYSASRRLLKGRMRINRVLFAAAIAGLFGAAVILTQLPAILRSGTLAELVTGLPLMIAAGSSWLCLWALFALEMAVRRRKIRY